MSHMNGLLGPPALHGGAVRFNIMGEKLGCLNVSGPPTAKTNELILIIYLPINSHNLAKKLLCAAGR